MDLEAVPLRDFAIALFIGALVGIEREKKQEAEPERGIGGLRTFILFAEAGAIAAWLSRATETPWIFVGAGALVAALVIAGYAAWVRTHPGDVGLTTEIAALVVYLLGGLTTYGQPEIAVALAITTSALLAWKEPLHGLVERIGRDDLYAGLKLLIATFIVLPVLPDRALDPWGALNPYRMWWLVILISGLSLLGYAASRWLGSGRGVPVTGLLGGLVSSTAVTLTFARRSREAPDDASFSAALAAGILAAWSVMFVRIGVTVAVLHAPLLGSLAIPLAALAGVGGVAAAVAYRRADDADGKAGEIALRNPFSLRSAMRFAALFAAVLLVAKIAEQHAGARGVYVVAALSGLTDVDAITLSMASGARGGGIAGATATAAIVIAALTNTAVKLGLVVALAGADLRRRVATAAAALAAAALVALLLG
ncbi:MAG: hypothetical protein DCC71_19365 [Proteobacteria bacterium]|nr:MAG: hypothetical protein DCC71_19365 [Pseudomonadota bacterium]